MNQKGMLTWDRTPKDVYYLYKANWNPAPMVYIASRGWTKRIGDWTRRRWRSRSTSTRTSRASSCS